MDGGELEVRIIIFLIFIVLMAIWIPLFLGAHLLKKLADIPEGMLDAIIDYVDSEAA